METENSRTGRQSINNNLPLFSQDEFVLTGFTHTPNFNNNKTNCMNNLTIFPPEKLDFIRHRSSKKSYYSSKGLRILMILGLLLFSISMFGQNVGDYRSARSGNWTAVSPPIDNNTWEYYNGLSWIPATTYPGENPGTNDVVIRNGHVITLDTDIDNFMASVTIGDSNSGT